VNLLYPTTCYGCGRSEAYFCPSCLATIPTAEIRPLPPYQGVLPIFHYRGAIKTSLLDLKYQFVSHLSEALSDLISFRLKSDFPNLLQFWLDNQYTLVPVPLHQFRHNWRGYNQSEIIAQPLASKLHLPYSNQLFFRHLYTSPQAQIHQKTDRLHHLKQAFCRDKRLPIPKNLIIFDDVFTTGSTIKSLASVIPSSSSLWILTIAG